jgi:hypothetical protein
MRKTGKSKRDMGTIVYVESKRGRYVFVHPKFLITIYNSGYFEMDQDYDEIEFHLSYIVRKGLVYRGGRLELDEERLSKRDIHPLILPSSFKPKEKVLSRGRSSDGKEFLESLREINNFVEENLPIR